MCTKPYGIELAGLLGSVDQMYESSHLGWGMVGGRGDWANSLLRGMLLTTCI